MKAQKEFNEEKHIILIKNAKRVRHFIHENPGSTYREMSYHFRQIEGFDPPVGWLLGKRYVIRKRNDKGVMGYFTRPIQNLRDAEPEDINEQPVQDDSEVDFAPEKMGIGGEHEV